jgi:hypothetical protein
MRPQCRECPWRDMEWMRAHAPDAVAAAAAGAEDWHCHVRMGECDGPRFAGVLVVVAK